MNESPSSPPEWLSLEPDEHVLLRTSPSRNLLLASLVVGFVVLTGVAILVSVGTDIATGRMAMFAVLLLILATIAGVFIWVEHREYVMTSRRVSVAAQLPSTRVSSIALDDVRDITVDQSGWREWIEVGDLQFHTNDGTVLRFAAIENPQVAYQRALESIESADRGV